MKLIFLDVDGVLNSKASFLHRDNPFPIDDDKVDLLAQIVKITGAELILSSTWRGDFDNNMNIIFKRGGALTLVEKLKKRGLKLIGKTGFDVNRETEIRNFLWDFSQNHEIESFIVLDDDIVHMPQLVKTNWNLGLTPHCVEKAIKMLSGENK